MNTTDGLIAQLKDKNLNRQEERFGLVAQNITI